MFLFNDILVITKQTSKRSLESKQFVEQLKLANVKLEQMDMDTDEGRSFSFTFDNRVRCDKSWRMVCAPLLFRAVALCCAVTVKADTPSQTYNMEAPSQEARNQWYNLLQLHVSECLQRRGTLRMSTR